MSTPNKVEVSQVNEVTTVEITTAGPQGPAGAQGETGEGSATVAIGTVTTGNAGTNASVTNVGSTTAATLNFTIPRGDTGAAGSDGSDGTDGAAATIAVGTVSTGAAGSSATVTNVGSSSAATFNFSIPKGDTGAQGPAGNDGADGAISDGDKGDIVVSNSGATFTVDNDVITTSKIANDAVTYAKIQNVSATDRVLGRDSSGAGVVEEITPANLRTMINVEDGADATDATNVDAAGAVMNSDLDGKGELLVGDGSGDPTALAAGTNGYVLKANSTTATGLEWSAAGSGGDVNQNAFSNVSVSGQDTVAADSTTDTLNIAAGSNVTITTNASSDTVTISSTDTNTTYTAGTGLSLSGTTFNVDQIALTTVQTAANESAQLALTTQEGDIVVRSDQNKSYVRNSGTAGTMADFTELLTPTDQVLSVNGNTGAITAAQIAAAVEAATDSNTFTDADHSKLNGIDVGAKDDQTSTEIKTLLQSDKLTVNEIADDAITTAKILDDAVTDAKLANSINTAIAANTAKVTNATHTGDVTGSTALTIANDAVTTDKIADDAVTADKLANSINTEIAANTAKVTNATHTGEVTGSTALTIADNVVDEANLKVSNSPTNGYVLTAQSGNTGGLTWAAVSSGGGGLVGGGSESLFVEAENSMDNDFSTQANHNYLSITPITINATLTITAGSIMYFSDFS